MFSENSTLACAVFLFFCITLNAADTPKKIIVRVNNSPIYEQELMANMPANQFAVNVDNLLYTKLNRLISARIIGEFLHQKNIVVPNELVNKNWAELEKNPPSAGCMCCRFPSLQLFMEQNAYSEKELRNEIRNNEGLNLYFLRQWEQHYPTSNALQFFIEKERSRVSKSHIKFRHIFQNTYQQNGYNENPNKIIKEKKEKINRAWQRLQKGESFDGVCREISEDTMSREKDGLLGCLPAMTFGIQIKNELQKMPTGQYSKPLQSTWGFHIFKCESMNNEDFTEILREEFINAEQESLNQNIFKQAKIEYPEN